jgi:hypothetical protein
MAEVLISLSTHDRYYRQPYRNRVTQSAYANAWALAEGSEVKPLVYAIRLPDSKAQDL